MFSVLFRYLVSVQVVNPEGLGPAATVEVATDEGGQYKKENPIKKKGGTALARIAHEYYPYFAFSPLLAMTLQYFFPFFVLAFPTFPTSMRNSAIGTRELDTSHPFLSPFRVPRSLNGT